MYVEYSSNNSGGGWWLSDDDWRALQNAGWVVAWAHLGHAYDGDQYARESNGIPKLVPGADAVGDLRARFARVGDDGVYRYMGALATEAYRPIDSACPSLTHAIAEFERVTGQNADDEGCRCCGSPHSFSLHDSDGRYV